MKKVLLIALALVTFQGFAQKETGIGIKAGVNYSQNGDLKTAVSSAANDLISGSDQKMGYHLGLYAKMKLPIFYLRPELIFTHTKSAYDFSESSGVYSQSKIDLPILLGYEILGPLHVFAGPSIQFVLGNDFDIKQVALTDLEKNTTIGFQFGAGLNLGRLGLDVRFERGLSPNQISLINNNITSVPESFIDTRPTQVIFALSYAL
ncbi:MAG: porin family protein [Flavobacteriaceae bacterium]